MKTHLLSLALFLPLLLSCGEDAPIITELEGQWRTDCVLSGGDPAVQANHKFVNDTYELTLTFYQESGSCTTQLGTLTAKGRFGLPGDAASPAGAKKINYVQSSLTLTTTAASPADGGCAGKTFTPGVAQDIAGITCSGTVMQSTGSTWFDQYVLSGTVLKPGKVDGPIYKPTNKGGSDADRPNTLGTTAFTKF